MLQWAGWQPGDLQGGPSQQRVSLCRSRLDGSAARLERGDRPTKPSIYGEKRSEAEPTMHTEHSLAPSTLTVRVEELQAVR
jgi:hypothetical protein